jgi:23S rRNA (adenine-N6)-dimethyltransferase
VAPGDLVVEVGAGPGMLTRALARTGARVIALELDPVLADRLRRSLAVRGVTVVEADALRWRWPVDSFAVVANLPFAGSGAILSRLLDPLVPLRRADVIVQWQLAARHAAIWPSTLRATYWRAWFDVDVAGRLARTAFAPVPSVDAALLRVVRRARPLVAATDHDAYRRFLESAWHTSGPLRKTLRSHVSSLELKRLASALGFSPEARPRDLDARQWAALFRFARRGR